MKKIILILICILFLSTFVLAQNKIEVTTIKETFAAGENITFKVSLFDSNNNLIIDSVDIIIQDATEINKIKKTVTSGDLVEVNLGENEIEGIWKITAGYQGTITEEFFSIEEHEEAKFSIEGDQLTIINTGNTDYSETVQIVIGNTVSSKKISLGIGEKTSFRLIAPDGTYNIKITDGKTIMTEEEISLTGQVVGILDEDMERGRTPLTGGVKPGEENKDDTFYYIKRNKFVYVFILVVVGLAILVAFEKNYKKQRAAQ